MRSVLLAVFFLVLAATSVTLVLLLVVPGAVGLLGEPTAGSSVAWRLLATLGVSAALVLGALYAAGLLWLFLACRLFPRDDVEQLLKAGPNTRLEIWVFERFSR